MKRKTIDAMTDAEYAARCLRQLEGTNPPAELVDSLLRFYMRCHSRGVRASRLLGRKAALALFADVLA